MTRHFFTSEQIQFLTKNIVGKTLRDLTMLFNKRFKTNLSERKIKFCCLHRKLKSGLPRGFQPGVPRKIRPIGTEIIYDKKKKVTYVKISDEGRTFSSKGRGIMGTWKRKNVFVWEEANGPIPEGHCVIFADQNHSNFALDNLVCVSVQSLSYMLHCGFLFTDPELTKTAVAIANHRITLKEKIKRKEEGIADA